MSGNKLEPTDTFTRDRLGVWLDSTPLQPVVAVALSSTCLGLRTPLREALLVLKERHIDTVQEIPHAKKAARDSTFIRTQKKPPPPEGGGGAREIPRSS